MSFFIISVIQFKISKLFKMFQVISLAALVFCLAGPISANDTEGFVTFKVQSVAVHFSAMGMWTYDSNCKNWTSFLNHNLIQSDFSHCGFWLSRYDESCLILISLQMKIFVVPLPHEVSKYLPSSKLPMSFPIEFFGMSGTLTIAWSPFFVLLIRNKQNWSVTLHQFISSIQFQQEFQFTKSGLLDQWMFDAVSCR